MRRFVDTLLSNLKGEVAHPITCNNETMVGMSYPPSHNHHDPKV